MKTISKNHIEFIALVAKGTNQQEAYRITCGNKRITPQTARAQGSKLAKRYSRQIQAEKEQAAKAIEEANKKAEALTALKSIVKQADADAKAFRILSKNDMVEDIYMVNGKKKVLKRRPTQLEIQRAYELYCKRFGSYCAKKVEVSGKDGLPIQTESTQVILYMPDQEKNADDNY